MTEIYLCDLSAGVLPAGAEALLPGWRRPRYEALRSEKPRRESLCAGLLYAYALRQRGEDPEAPVTILPAGKPVLTGREDLFFSLSHSGQYVLCAVSDAPVGADVQELRPVRPTMARRFHPAEQARLAALDPEARQAAFLRLWARKEAWVKAVSRERFLALDEANLSAPLPGLEFRDYALPGACACVCAVSGQPLPLPRLLTPAELLP